MSSVSCRSSRRKPTFAFSSLASICSDSSRPRCSQAARVWYARVFVPVFAASRGADLQSWYPALRHADMVAALFEEQREMRQRREHAAEQVAVGGDEQG